MQQGKVLASSSELRLLTRIPLQGRKESLVAAYISWLVAVFFLVLALLSANAILLTPCTAYGVGEFGYDGIVKENPEDPRDWLWSWNPNTPYFIEDWRSCGECEWRIADEDGVQTLRIRPAEGRTSGTLASWSSCPPWVDLGVSDKVSREHRVTLVDRVVVEPGVRAVTCASMFKGFANTVEFDLAGLDTSVVKDMSGMFRACCSLESIDLSNLSFDNVQNMSDMFSAYFATDGDNGTAGCRKLSSVTFPAGATRGVTDMSGMFGASCTGSLKLKGLDTSGATTMRGMFSRCGASSIDLSGFNTAQVTSMAYMFSGCQNVTALDLSAFDTRRVSNMDAMFGKSSWDYPCGRLRKIVVGASFKTSSQARGMFEGCTSLVGGNGTAYSASHIDGAYGRIDAKGMPGYFTAAPGVPIPVAPGTTAKPTPTKPVAKNPLAKVKLSKVKAKAAGKRAIKVSWKKLSSKTQKKIKGYQIKVSTSKKFSKSKTKTYTAQRKAASKTIKSLKRGKIYYVKVRAYTSGKAYPSGKAYGPWSKTVKVRVR